tara:strand:+ start:45 stop:863 length:819 start_codon:yes stop_codon:yes gene_type:complete
MVDEAKQEENLEPTPYHNAYRKDLDKPVETEAVETKDTEEATPSNTTSFLDTDKQTKQQEHDFQKRYNDLKTHYDRKVNEWKQKEKQLTQKPKYVAPKSTTELEEFKERYPDVYDVVESISHLQADRRVEDIETRLSELRNQEAELTKQNSLTELTTLHPDFSELKESNDFTSWLNQQPENISDGIYKNNTNAKWAARIIDLYKAEHNLQNKQTTKPNAAQAVTKTQRGSITTEGGKKIWSVSEIAKLKPQQFAKYEKEIDTARREGRIEQI